MRRLLLIALILRRLRLNIKLNWVMGRSELRHKSVAKNDGRDWCLDKEYSC